MINLTKIQEFLKSEKLDGWLLADFHARNGIAVELLDLSPHLTRRFFYFIPAQGEPTAFLHNIEKDKFTHLQGKAVTFSSYRLLESLLSGILKGHKRIAMEYSPSGRLPYIGLVDAGTIELVRSFGVEIVSSADIVANFQARMTPEQIISHKKAAALINGIKDEAFAFIQKCLTHRTHVDEKMVVDFIMNRFQEENLVTDFPPICAVDANISNGHYQPPDKNSAPIRNGNLVLIDLWAKKNESHSIFADITWMAYAGKETPEEYRKIFDIVSAARDRAVKFIEERFGLGPLYGYEVDDACRKVIVDAGYGDFFFHRTGHSILESTHGPGPNIDNLETEDRRRLSPGHLFSIEPGIYLEKFGVRSEIDCMITESGPEITTQPVQGEIIALLK